MKLPITVMRRISDLHVVLGSGPASTMCAVALVERGVRVLMIDPGEQLEQARSRVVEDALRASSHAQWGSELSRMVRENTSPDVRGLPRKLAYGSDFPFRWKEHGVELHQENVETLTSHAIGGLSNVWGANILPLLSNDTRDWPFPVETLGAFYRKVAARIPVSARVDGLAELFPLFTDNPSPLQLSSQAKSFLSDLSVSKDALKDSGISFGASRLAVRVDASAGGPGCVSCGLCLYGCPHRLIYSSGQTVDVLRTSSSFEYRSGFTAYRLEEREDGCIVHLRSVASGCAEEVRGAKVFVGCGAVCTTALMLRSLDAYGQEIRLRDSQYFLTPFLRFRGPRGVTTEDLHTLSQVAMELFDNKISSNFVHLLFYTYNDMYRRALERLLGKSRHLVQPLVTAMLGRLMVIQGYLHSDLSGSVGVTVERTADSQERITLRGYENPATRVAVSGVHRKLFGLARSLRGVPLTLMTQVGAVGKGYHLGGSFPMRSNPGRFETDTLGRLPEFRRIHLVDASIFSSVPATNITFPAMANAYRIGEEALDVGQADGRHHRGERVRGRSAL